MHWRCYRMASSSYDKTVRLWDLQTGLEVARLEGHAGGVNALAVMPDGRLASGSSDKTVRLWDLQTGAEIARLEGHTDRVDALAVLPDGRLASGSQDDTIRLWNPRSGTETARLEVHSDKSTVKNSWLESHVALTVLPDGRLASGSENDAIRLWDTKSGAETAPFEHRSRHLALSILPDGRLVSGGKDGAIRIWDPTSGTESARLQGHGHWVTAIAVLPNGRLASVSYGDKTIRLWELRKGVEIARLEVDSNLLCLAACPDGRLVAGDFSGRLHWLEIVV